MERDLWNALSGSIFSGSLVCDAGGMVDDDLPDCGIAADGILEGGMPVEGMPEGGITEGGIPDGGIPD